MLLCRAAILEAKKAMEKAAEIEKRKIVEKLPELRCPTCLKQFTDNDSFKSHDFDVSFGIHKTMIRGHSTIT